MTRIILAVWMGLAISAGAGAQAARDAPPAPPSATIAGRTIAGDTNEPLRNVRVAVGGGTAATRVVMSDAEGRFTLSAPTGRYTISAKKPGFAPFELAVIAPSRELEIRLARGAVISGRVVDEFGDPRLGARVTVETLSAPEPRTIATTDTDDRGEYRLGSLPAGSVVVGVSVIGQFTPTQMGSRVVAMVPTPYKVFYPGTRTAANADAIVLASGDERSRIDFRVPAEPLPVFPAVIVGTQSAAAGSRPAADAASTGVIRGRIVSTSGPGIPHALVRLIFPRDARQSRSDRADDSGQFEFRDLVRGQYTIIASKAGFAPAPPDAPRAAPAGWESIGSSHAVSDGDERVEIKLAPWGSVTGRVLDEYGEPVEGARVQTLALRYQGGRRRLAPGAGALRPTDELGRYRVYGVPPGRYVISATAGIVSSAELPNYARSYYPGTADAVAAQYVSVGLAEEVMAIDFPLTRTKTARVAGQLLNAAGEPRRAGTLNLIPSYRSSVSTVPVGARISADGVFEFPNVAPGQYVIQANRGRTNGSTEGEFGALPVTVNGEDVTGLVLQTSAGSTIAGRFIFDTADRTKLPVPQSVELSAVAVDLDLSPMQTASANVDDDWTFEMSGINGPRRLQLVRTPAEWALKEVRVRGSEVTDRTLPFGTKNQSLTDVEVVLTDRVSVVSGAVTDSNARAVVPAYVIVAATDRSRWYPGSRFMRLTTTASAGAFSLSGLPFGSYYAIAVDRLPNEGEDGWQDPDFLEPLLAGAATVTVAEGERQVVNLRMRAR